MQIDPIKFPNEKRCHFLATVYMMALTDDFKLPNCLTRFHRRKNTKNEN